MNTGNKNNLPIVRRTYLADGSGYLQTILGSTKPGTQKLQFPYEIPTIKTEVALDPATTKTLLYIAGGITVGAIASAVIKRL